MTTRSTAQKKMIGDALMCLDHPTAQEVYEEVRRDYPQISLGTVYRNLGQMAGEGAVLRLTFDGSPDRFDPHTHEHFHVVCNSCGQVFDTNESVPPALIQKLDAAVEECTGVRVESRALVFNGVCARCR